MSLNEEDKDYIIAALIHENRTLKAQIAAIMEQADTPAEKTHIPQVHGAGVYMDPKNTVNLKEET